MRTVLTTLLLAFLLTSTAEAQPGPPDQARPIEGVILMKFAPDALEAPPQQLRANDLNLQGRQAARLRQLLNARRGPGQKLFRNFTPADTLGRHRQTGEPVRLKDLSRWYRFPVRDTTDVEALAARLQELPVVLKATPDYEAFPASFPPESGPALARTEPNDPLYSQQWGYDDFDDTDVDAPEAWSLNTGRSDVTVAVVDGGVDLDHPDLDPGDRSRVIQGYDFGDDDSDPDDDRSSGAWTDHGTPVAGTIGARTDNGQGVAGLMWNLQIMPLKIVESNKTGGAPVSNVAEAFNYARTNGADIINYSGSGTNPFGPRSEAAYNAYASGMIIVSSAGNDYKGSINYPAALHTSIGVGATDQSDTRHIYSNYGSRLDISAPSGFETTSRGNNNDLYDGFGGTSQAAPVVSGLAGLLFAESRDEGHNLSNNDVVHLLERTADNVQAMNGDFDVEFGHGRVNAYEALLRLNDPYEVSHGTASFTKIYNDDQVSFPDGFTTETGVSFGAGTYICDIYKLSASVSSTDFYYKEKPWFWLPVTEKGFSAANPNDGSRYLSKSVSKSSAEATTYFYYVESNVNGQDIGWIPFDPTVHKRNGGFEYTVIGKPGTPPLDASLSGPSSLDSGESGTWNAGASGGSGSTTYDWFYRPLGSSTWYSASCSGSSCTQSWYNNTGTIQVAGVKVNVTKGSETDAASATVTVQASCSGTELECIKQRGLAVHDVRAEAQDGSALLSWKAAGSEVPSTFVVEHRADSTGAWTQRATVSAADSVRSDTADASKYRYRAGDLAVGTHQFRLGISGGKARQYSRPVTARIRLGEPYRLSVYPNPVSRRATIQLAVREAQDVSVRLYDLLGRQVMTLHDASIPAQETVRLSLDASQRGLSSGTYFVRIAGEHFTGTRRISIVR